MDERFQSENRFFTPETRRKKLVRSLESAPPPLPDWLSAPEPVQPSQTEATKALTLAQFEMVYPRVLELMYAGSTLAKALRELPIEIDQGAFLRWIKAESKRMELYKEAKEIRTEAWAGKMIEYAEGINENGDVIPEDVSRSKLKVDTLKWLMGADNRKQYGDTKQVEVTGGISITSALEQARARLNDVIDAEWTEQKQLESGDEDDD